MGLFSKKAAALEVDIHSHLIPNIDDGSQSMTQSVQMIKELIALGVKKIITTPHIHPSYPNSPELILAGLGELRHELARLELSIEIEAAAEYYVDEVFHQKVKEKSRILSFGTKYVLVECAFLNKPIFFESVMFDLLSNGYTPVLAHPERYIFLEGSIEWLENLKTAGVLLQINLGSIAGYYGPKPERIGKLLLKNRMADFLGSDLHRLSFLNYLKKGLKNKEVQQSLQEKRVKNYQLL